MFNRWRLSLRKRVSVTVHSAAQSFSRNTESAPTGMFPAQETALATPELLELILARLPMRDLLVSASRVSKMWNAVTRTPTLQRALFFQPDIEPTSPLMRNPLLMAMFPPFFASEGPDGDSPGGPPSIMKMPWANAPDAFRRANASWRRMLVVQPPAPTLIVTNSYHTPGGTFERRARIDFDDGLRMGVLYDLLLPRVHRLGTWFCMRWPGLGDVETEGELTLATMDMVRATPHKSPIDKRFYSKGRQAVDIALEFV
ncbi:hypothetical protein C8F04DRAFT_1100134 [Mycena alexandri]|uniref:F-box domain-containing protein n=1 Tax=Mycena alexandri TaxID=1745969 RepID=A0AAD6SU10_9AGAR|nr:hypothetical protein C8F04DRAFT_1106688 [Mycena alexandri]KAJ7034796.1 hypothetical protein C8F04DRAFT_1100134 [Mycena alexandri]